MLRAARRLADRAGCPPHVRITLDKRIPVAAGLGGGSADAAATLRGLCRLWRLELTLADLLPLALELGADVPVCLLSRPARMRGIGERLEPIELPALDLVLANPNQAVPTAQVFAGRGSHRTGVRTRSADAQRPRGPAGVAAPRAAMIWRRRRAASRRRSLEVIEALSGQPGCRLARMSGSGATCFGVFDDAPAAARAARTLRRTRPEWWVVSTATRAA